MEGRNEAAKAEYATAKIAVFWNINHCPVPDGYDPRRVRPSIEAAFKNLGYSGPVSITAFGNTQQLSPRVLRGLNSTGIDVQHSATHLNGTLMFSGILKWRRHNPPPATMMLISDEVSHALCRLQQVQKYNLCLGYTTYPTRKASALVTCAEWLWESLLGDGSETSTNVLKKCSVLQKCSETGEAGKSAMLSCKSCGFYGQNLEHFYKHLSSKQHVWEEDNIRLAVPVRPEPAEDKQVENSPKSSKRLKKAVPDLCS